MKIIKCLLIILLISIIIKILYDEKINKEYYDNVTKAKFDLVMNNINDVVNQQNNKYINQETNNTDKQNFMNFNKLKVTNRLKSKNINIKNSIKLNNYILTIVNNELIIKDLENNIIWTSVHLYNSVLYDSSGINMFFINNTRHKGQKLSYPTTNIFNTKNSLNVINIAFNGGLTSDDGIHKVNVNTNVWYNRVGIELINISLPQIKSVIGLKSAKLYYGNCYIIPSGTTSNEELQKRNRRILENSRETTCDDTQPDNMIYGCFIYYVNSDAINSEDSEDENDSEVEILIYPHRVDVNMPEFTIWKRLSMGPAFIGLTYIPGLEDPMYAFYRMRAQLGCEIYKGLKVAWEWVEGVGSEAIHWIKFGGETAYGWSYDQGGKLISWSQNAGEVAYGWSYNQAGKAISWIKNDVGETVVDTANTAVNNISSIGGTAVNTIGNVGGTAVNTIGDVGGTAVDTIGNVGDTAVDTVGGFVEDVVDDCCIM
jgi:hypothetical protein